MGKVRRTTKYLKMAFSIRLVLIHHSENMTTVRPIIVASSQALKVSTCPATNMLTPAT
jgi:hypothetical protein